MVVGGEGRVFVKLSDCVGEKGGEANSGVAGCSTEIGLPAVSDMTELKMWLITCGIYSYDFLWNLSKRGGNLVLENVF